MKDFACFCYDCPLDQKMEISFSVYLDEKCFCPSFLTLFGFSSPAAGRKRLHCDIQAVFPLQDSLRKKYVVSDKHKLKRIWMIL